MTDAEARLRVWLRDYGGEKNPQFVDDLNAVLSDLLSFRIDLETGREVADTLRWETARLLHEVERLKAGRFTREELQSLCHTQPADNCPNFRRGCEAYQRGLFGDEAVDAAKREEVKEAVLHRPTAVRDVLPDLGFRDMEAGVEG